MRLSRLSMLALPVVLALAGCASSGGLHPSGHLVDAASLHGERALSRYSMSPAAWPATDWWRGLGDDQLSALIDEALKDNPSLASADARARQAQAASGAADAERKPTVNGGASVGGARPPNDLLAPQGHYEAAKYVYASFSYSLDLWGGERANYEAAVGQARAAEIDARAARIELSANVARAYVQLGFAYAQQDVANDERARADKARTLTRQRVNAGLDSKLQLRQVDSEVASAERLQAEAARAIDSARSSLSSLLGKGPDRGLTIARPKPLSTAALAVPPDLPLELIGHRADLVAARWRVEATGKDIFVAKTKFLPDVKVSALAGLLTLGGGNLFQAGARFYQAGPALSLPIFDGGRLRANLSDKDAKYDLAVAQYNQNLVNAVNQVADDYAGQQSLIDQIAAQQRALTAAQDAWQLAQQRYEAGVGSYLEALSVRQQLLDAERALAGLKAQQNDLSVQLIQALGGGYVPQPDERLSSVSPSPHS